MTDLRKAAEMAAKELKELIHWHGIRYSNDKLVPPHRQTPEIKSAMKTLKALRQALAQPDLARVGEVGVWGQVVECEQHKAVTEDGWCEWVCPKPTGYLMQCCDCELVHEVGFRVVKYEPRPSEAFEVVSDTNLQAQMRLRRRDDISPPKREWVGLTDADKQEAFDETQEASGGFWEFADYLEAKLKEKNA